MLTSNTHKVLLVEDEPDIANVLQLHLEDSGAEVTHAIDGISGLAEAAHGSWSLVMLDLNIPGIDGIELCSQLRRLDPLVPIMMVTARATEQDRITGLSSGADHYITKPFSVQEVIAQVQAIFRRADIEHNKDPNVSNSICVQDIVITPSAHRVEINGNAIALTAREFDLLLCFVQSPGTVFSRQQLLKTVWGYTHQGYMHTVNSHINRLRAKIEPDPSNPTYIQTVWGIGYRLQT